MLFISPSIGLIALHLPSSHSESSDRAPVSDMTVIFRPKYVNSNLIKVVGSFPFHLNIANGDKEFAYYDV